MLEIIITTILIYTFINVFLKKYGIPTIIGYIVTGTIISYTFGLKDMANNEELKLIAEMGIVFLMFTIGLELPIKRISEIKKDVFIIGGLQVLITFMVFYLFSVLVLRIDTNAAIIISAGLSFSSTAIVLKTINENNEINKSYGKKVLGILIFQDLTVIPLLVIISIMSNKGMPVNSIIAEVILGTIALMWAIWFISKYLLDRFLYLVSKTENQEIFISAIILLILGISYGAHMFGLSFSLGALIAGIMISETHYKHQVEADLIPFRNLLLGIFFITVGMQINLQIIKENILLILLLLTSIIIIKSMIIYLININFSNKEDSLKTTLSLFQIGEFAIVIFELSIGAGIFEVHIGQILIVSIILSMLATPIILKNINNISNKIFNKKYQISEIKEDMENKIIIIGYSRLGKAICEILKDRKINYIIIERKLKALKEASDRGEPIIFGDATNKEFLKNIDIDKSKHVIVTIGYKDKLYDICKSIDSIAKKSSIIVKTSTFEDKDMLDKIRRVSKIIVETENTATSMINAITKTQNIKLKL